MKGKDSGTAKFTEAEKCPEPDDEKNKRRRFGCSYRRPGLGRGRRGRIRRWGGTARTATAGKNGNERNEGTSAGLRRLVQGELKRWRSVRPHRHAKQRFQIQRRQIRHDWFIENFDRRLGRRNRFSRNFGNAIAAASACQMYTVRQKQFAGVQHNFFSCPVNAIAEAIGNVNLARSGKPDGMGGSRPEIRVVGGDQGILAHRGFQLVCVRDTARYDGVWIN
jgi:hypothetical protein